MLFADDIVLVGESPEEVKTRHEEWIESLEYKILKICRSKTECIEFDFTGRVYEANRENR